jgi:HEAT repeat protein
MSLLSRLKVPLVSLWEGTLAILGALDAWLVRFADLFGVRITTPWKRYVTFQTIFLIIYLIGMLPMPVLPMVALGFGYLGVLAVGRAWVKNEKQRQLIARKVIDGNPDDLVDLRLAALVSALQLLVLFPLIFYQAHHHFHLYLGSNGEIVPDNASPLIWGGLMIDSYNKAFLGVLELYDVHPPKIDVEHGSRWGRHLVLLCRLTFNLLLIQGVIRLFTIYETIRDAVTAIVRDPSMALAVGRRTVTPLLERLRNGNVEVRRCAAEVLGKLGDGRAVEPLIQTLGHDADPQVRAEAARSLGWLKALSAKGPLIEALADPEPDVGGAAAVALAELGETGDTTDALLVALRDRDPGKRADTAQALAGLGELRSLEPLIELALLDPEEVVRDRAIEAIKTHWAVQAVARLIMRLQEAPKTSVWNQLFGAGQPRSEHDLALRIRQRAAEALGHLGELSAVDALIKALKDRDRLVRRAAAAGLGKLGDPRALDSLVLALRDKERDVRSYAGQALGLLGQPRAVEALIKAWQKESDGEARGHIAQAARKLDPQLAEKAGIV